jgi:DNA repair protein RadC
MSVESGYNPTIKELPPNERPRERLLLRGVNAVSNAELLAIILRTGVQDENVVRVAQRLLAGYGNLAGLVQASIAELESEKELGPAKVAQLKAALELGRRMLVESPEERPQVRSPADAANLVMSEMGLLEQENLRIMLLDTKNRVLSTPTVYVGSLNTSVIRVGELRRGLLGDPRTVRETLARIVKKVVLKNGGGTLHITLPRQSFPGVAPKGIRNGTGRGHCGHSRAATASLLGANAERLCNFGQDTFLPLRRGGNDSGTGTNLSLNFS